VFIDVVVLEDGTVGDERVVSLDSASACTSSAQGLQVVAIKACDEGRHAVSTHVTIEQAFHLIQTD